MLENEHGKWFDNDVTGQTAEEVYKEWLENKDNPIEPQPSDGDKIIVLSKQLCEMELEMMKIRR